MEPQKKSEVGPIIGTVVIIAVIILGGLYFWGKRLEEAKLKQNLVTDSTSSQSTESDEASRIRNTSSSDDLNSIQADLNATSYNNLNSETNIEAE